MLPLDPATFVAFLAVATATIISPGPDTLIILRYALTSGHRVGLAAVVGVQAGLVGHTVLAVAGLSLLIVQIPALYSAIALAGAAYLFWLGLQALGAGVLALDGSQRPVTKAKAFRDAVLCNLLNPKVILLFLALMPPFVAPERGRVPLQLALMAAAIIVINTLWQCGLALGAEWTRRWLSRPRVQRMVNTGTGIVLVVLAAAMLWEHGIRNWIG